jgi:transposase
MEPGLPGLGQHPGQKEGELTGLNPTDRGKTQRVLRSKRHVVVDHAGIPLAALLSGANRHDAAVFQTLRDAIPPIKQPSGQRRTRPDTLHADKGYDYPCCRAALRPRTIQGRIARKGIDASERLGQHRWVVERTLAWLNRFRRLTVRYERRADIHHAFPTLGCALICGNFLP